MEQSKTPTKAVASLALGIISIVCVLGFFYTSFVGAVTGLIAIILASKARKEYKSGIATAGFVCGIVGTSLSLLMFASCCCYVAYVDQFFRSYSFFW